MFFRDASLALGTGTGPIVWLYWTTSEAILQGMGNTGYDLNASVMTIWMYCKYTTQIPLSYEIINIIIFNKLVAKGNSRLDQWICCNRQHLYDRILLMGLWIFPGHRKSCHMYICMICLYWVQDAGTSDMNTYLHFKNNKRCNYLSISEDTCFLHTIPHLVSYK